MTTLTRPGDTGELGGIERQNEPLSQSVDWIVSILLVLTGGVLTYGGLVAYWATDRATLVRWVAEGTLRSDVFSNAELVEVTNALGVGVGASIALVGVVLVAAGIGFHVLETRARRRFEETGTVTPNVVASAILGAFVTIVGSFLVLSPLLGGAVAGYVNTRRNGNRYTAASLSGLFASVPVVVLFGGIIAAVASGSPRLVPLVGLVLVVAVAVVVGLSALGGYIGTVLGGSQH